MLGAGRLDEAQAAYDDVAELLDGTARVEGTNGADPIRRLWCDSKRGQIALARRDLAGAQRWFDVALAGYRAAPGPLHWNAVYGPIDYLAFTAWLDGRDADAEMYASEVIERSQGKVPPPLYGRYVRAELCARAGRAAEAHALLDTIAAAGGVPVGMGGGLAMSLDVWRARVCIHEGRFGDAAALLAQALVARNPDRPLGDLEVQADYARVRALAGEVGAAAEIESVLAEASRRGSPLTAPLAMAAAAAPSASA